MRKSTAETLNHLSNLDFLGAFQWDTPATGKRRGLQMNTLVNSRVPGTSPGAGGNLAHNNATNDGRYADLLAKTEQLGAIAGQGEDVQVKHLLMVTQAAFEGVISTVDKGPNTPDDATVITERYWAARNKNIVFNPKAPNQRKTISCIRSCIALGAWDKGAPGELMGMINQAMSGYTKARKDPTKAKRLIDAANYLVSIARKMKRSEEILDADVLEDMMFKKERELSTVEEVLAGLRKTLENLYSGKHAVGQVATPNIDNARKLINREIKSIMEARKQQDLDVAAEDIAAAADQQARDAEKATEQAGVAAPATDAQ